MTQREYAISRGLNPSTVSRQIKSGLLTLVDGRIDPIAADEARNRNLNPARSAEAARRKKNRPADGIAAQLSEKIGHLKLTAEKLDAIPPDASDLRAVAIYILVAANVTDTVLWHVLGSDAVERLFGPSGPPQISTVTAEQVCAGLGIAFDPAIDTEVDRILEAGFEMFHKRERKGKRNGQ